MGCGYKGGGGWEGPITEPEGCIHSVVGRWTKKIGLVSTLMVNLVTRAIMVSGLIGNLSNDS